MSGKSIKNKTLVTDNATDLMYSLLGNPEKVTQGKLKSNKTASELENDDNMEQELSDLSNDSGSDSDSSGSYTSSSGSDSNEAQNGNTLNGGTTMGQNPLMPSMLPGATPLGALPAMMNKPGRSLDTD